MGGTEEKVPREAIQSAALHLVNSETASQNRSAGLAYVIIRFAWGKGQSVAFIDRGISTDKWLPMGADQRDARSLK
jgi:hypothetical protein